MYRRKPLSKSIGSLMIVVLLMTTLVGTSSGISAGVLAQAQATVSDDLVTAAAQSCAKRVNDTHAKLLECVTLEGVREHQAAFQAIADANNDNRAAGMSGYDASLNYIQDKMTAAGYTVTLNPFTFHFLPLPTLERRAPDPTNYKTDAFTGSGSGDVSADVTAVDINLILPRGSDSGCEAADFASFPAGNIALIQRGTCPFAQKVANALDGGAVGVIIFNQGDTPQREELFVGTIDPPTTLPVVGASFATGEALAQPGTVVRISLGVAQDITQYNLIAESKDGDPNHVVMVGAHLDSVRLGPGINDNGSGSAAILEVAEQMAKVKPYNKVRFAWWGAEEANLIGSTAYVAGLSQAEQDRITLYLNFDMIGSPNYGIFIYDGDDSDAGGAPAGPPGSDQIEDTFESFFDARGIAHAGTDFDGRSDYGPFIEVGIPAGGLFTGAEGIKTAERAALWGGTAGQQYDPCYHRSCDTYDNNSNVALDLNSDAVAYAVLHYAMNPLDMGIRLDINTVRDSLNSLLPTGDNKTDKSLQKAITKLDQALGAGLWQGDGEHLTPKGATVFHRLRDAVKELVKIKSPPAAVTDAINSLVSISRSLAQIALDEAIAASGNASLIAKAQSELAKGDQDLSEGKYANAISHDEEAWEYAQKAVGNVVIAASDESAPEDLEASEDEGLHLHEDEPEDAELSNQVFLPLVNRQAAEITE